MPRALDHIVLAVKDLKAAIEAYKALGFTVTPIAYHPFGTKNALVQIGQAFLELLTVHDEALFPDEKAGHFSFPRFNRDFLKERQGASMLVFRSQDVDGDLSSFKALGFEIFPRFDFERQATEPDGSKKKVGFSLGFLRHDLMAGTGFFVCHNHYPENFWKAEYQKHANGADLLRSVLFVADNPSDHHEFLGGFSGQREMRSTSAGLEIDVDEGRLEILTPSALHAFYGIKMPAGMPREGGVAALGIAIDLKKGEECLKNAGLTYIKKEGSLIVQADDVFGCALILIDRSLAV